MKDLYTFDSTLREAQATYAQVHAAYARIFSALKLPILVAEASSGDMGGDLSHEFHLPASIGDDSVACCDSCDYAANDEVATTKAMPASSHGEHVAVWRGISKDRTRLINAWFPTGDGEAEQRYSSSDVNLLQIKAAVPDVDTGISDAISHWAAALTETPANSKGPSAVQLINIVDSRIHPDVVDDISQGRSELLWPKGIPREASLPSSTVISSTADGRPLHLLRVRSGDACPRCETGTLRVQKALELGHTFHLSTRYTVPLSATVAIPPSAKLLETSGPPSTAADSMSSRHVPMEMGCHGIGVSRIIGAVAHHFADRKGLNWPPVIAPYKVVIVPGPRTAENDALQVYQALSSHGTTETTFIDAILDDRDTSLPWKLKDADAAGFPVIVVLGKAWADNRVCEVQCRRLATTQFVPLEQLASVTSRLLHELWQ